VRRSGLARDQLGLEPNMRECDEAEEGGVANRMGEELRQKLLLHLGIGGPQGVLGAACLL
jgi:hypothetical protein